MTRCLSTRIHAFLGVSLLVIALGEGATQAQTGEARRLISLGQKAKDIDTKIRYFSEAIKKSPGHWLPRALRAQAYLNQKKHEAAISDATEAIRLQPKHAGLYALRGEAQRLRGNFKEATQDATAALQLDAKNVQALCTRGAARMAQNEAEEALKDFDAALRLDDRYTFAIGRRAQLLAGLRRYEGALKDCERLAKLLPESPEPYRLRAEVYARQNKPQGALAAARKAAELAPNDAEIRLLLGRLQLENKLLSDAIASFDKVLTSKPDHVLAFARRGEAYRRKEEFAKAIEDSTKAIRLDPKCAYALATRGAAYAATKEWDYAVADLSKAISQSPTYAFAIDARMRVYAAKNQWDNVVSDATALAKLVENDQARSVAQMMLGVAYCKKGLSAKAIEVLTEAIRLDGKNARAYLERANAYRMRGLLAEAVTDCNDGLKADPNRTFGYLLRGVSFFQWGKYKEAQADLDRISTMDKNQDYAAWVQAYKAEILRQSDRYSDAVKCASYALTAKPKDAHPMAYLVRAASRRQMGLYRKAVADCSEAIRLDSAYAYAYAERAAAHRALRRYDATIRDCDQGISLAPLLLLAYCERGYALLAKYRGEGAVQSSKAAKLPTIMGTGTFDVPLNLASSEERAMRVETVAVAGTDPTRRTRPYAPEQVKQEQSNAKSHPLDKAVSDFKMLLNMGHERASSAYGLALCLYEMGRFAEAKAVCDKMISKGVRRPKILLARAKSQYALGRIRKGLEDAKSALALDVKSPAAFLAISYGHALAGQWGDCRSNSERGMALKPSPGTVARLLLVWYSARMHEVASERQVEVSLELSNRAKTLAVSSDEWPGPVILALVRGTKVHELPRIVKASEERVAKKRLCQALYYLASKELAAGRVALAKDLLRRSVEMGTRQNLEYLLSSVELQRLVSR